MDIHEQIAQKAEEWAKLKVPYRHRGFSTRGCDCTGLLVGILKSLGFLQTFEMPYYPPDWNLNKVTVNHLMIQLPLYAKRIPVEQMKRGNVLVFKFGRQVSHTGIFIGDNLFVHSYLTRYTWYGRIQGSQWGRRLWAVYRMRPEKLL